MLVACSTWYTLCFIHQVIFDFESTFDFLVLRNNLSFNSNAFSREWFCTRPLFETAGGKRQISYGSLDFCYDPSIKYTKRFTFTDCGKSFFSLTYVSTSFLHLRSPTKGPSCGVWLVEACYVTRAVLLLWSRRQPVLDLFWILTA